MTVEYQDSEHSETIPPSDLFLAYYAVNAGPHLDISIILAACFYVKFFIPCNSKNFRYSIVFSAFFRHPYLYADSTTPPQEHRSSGTKTEPARCRQMIP